MDSNKTTLYIEDQLPVSGPHTGETNQYPILVQFDGAKPCKRYILTQSISVIGRQRNSVQIWIDDPSVSRQHCQIQYDPQQPQSVRITDLKSSNHTYVNGQQILIDFPLPHKAKIRIGLIELRFFAPGTTDHDVFEAAYTMAVQDQLLQVYRKEYLLEQLSDQFALAQQSKRPLALLFLDLDKFKVINDTYGHDAGDQVLQQVCSVIKSQLSNGYMIGRYGGEEFCVLCPDTAMSEAYSFAENIRKAVESLEISYQEHALKVTISIGISCTTDGVDSTSDLIQQADQMMYQSKSQGRNRVSIPYSLGPSVETDSTIL